MIHSKVFELAGFNGSGLIVSLGKYHRVDRSSPFLFMVKVLSLFTLKKEGHRERFEMVFLDVGT